MQHVSVEVLSTGLHCRLILLAIYIAKGCDLIMKIHGCAKQQLTIAHHTRVSVIRWSAWVQIIPDSQVEFSEFLFCSRFSMHMRIKAMRDSG